MTQLADSSFIFNGALDSFVTGIFQDIVTANKLPVRPLVFVSRLPRENAYSMGSGLFTVDIGLLASTKTVEELAFIFSHELAHDQLGHQRETLIELSSGAEDRDEAYRRLRRRSTGSRKRDKLIDGLREQAYGLSRSSRMAELAADSLGLVYLSKTDYYSGIAAEALENIRQEEIDRDDVVGCESRLIARYKRSLTRSKNAGSRPPPACYLMCRKPPTKTAAGTATASRPTPSYRPVLPPSGPCNGPCWARWTARHA